MAIKITGVGSYIPKLIIPNTSFEKNDFYNADGTRFNAENKIIIEKFKSITGIAERRYVEDKLNNSDIGAFASEIAIEDSKIDPETIDYIIVAHNYGDISFDSRQSDAVPSIASRIKQKIKDKEPKLYCLRYPFWMSRLD